MTSHDRVTLGLIGIVGSYFYPHMILAAGFLIYDFFESVCSRPPKED